MIFFVKILSGVFFSILLARKILGSVGYFEKESMPRAAMVGASLI